MDWLSKCLPVEAVAELKLDRLDRLIIRHYRSTYTTMAKWVGLLQESDDELSRSKHSLWPWTASTFLLIDDINPGSPPESNKYSSADVAAYVCHQHEARNKQALRNMSVAWVVGSNREGDSVEQWIDLLRSFEIPNYFPIVHCDISHGVPFKLCC